MDRMIVGVRRGRYVISGVSGLVQRGVSLLAACCAAGAIAVAFNAGIATAQDAPASARSDIIGSENSEVYHTRDCPACKRILPQRRVSFVDEAAAQAAGRRKCKWCISTEEKEIKGNQRPPADKKSARRVSSDRPAAKRPPAAKESASSRPVRVKIVEARRGDTLRADNGETLRLIGISCPEPGAELGNKARESIEKRLKGRSVELLFDPAFAERDHLDSWRRRLVYLQLPDEADAAEALLEAGLAWVEPLSPGERAERYADTEAAARDAQRGIWSALKGPAGEREVKVFARDRTYHAPDCGHVASADDLKTMSVNSARAAGFHACTRYREK